MHRLPNTLAWVAGLALMASSAPALAHVGAGVPAGIVAGLVHPLTGLDHLLVILAVGMLAGRQGGHALWVLPVTFLVAMAASAALTLDGAAWAGAELGVIASMLAAGAALALRIRGPLLATVAAAALFAAFHGHLHGAEAAPWAGTGFLAGMLLATAALHAIGLVLGRAATLEQPCRACGLAVIATGVVIGV